MITCEDATSWMMKQKDPHLLLYSSEHSEAWLSELTRPFRCIRKLILRYLSFCTPKEKVFLAWRHVIMDKVKPVSSEFIEKRVCAQQ